MYKRLLLCILSLGSVQLASAQTPVWSTDIAPVLYNNCATCHRSGGIAPFSLLSYQDAFTMGGSISAAVQSGIMPPWPPDPSYSRLAHERLLSQGEINKIVNWVNGGMPQGDPNLAPPPPVFNNNGDLPGTPDLVAKIPSYISTAASGDVYQCFVVPSGLLASRYISAFEAVPGNRSMVHHVLVYADTTGTCAALDAATPGPGYTNFGGVGSNDAVLLGAWVPGSSPMQYPGGFGVRLPQNADIILQIHYPAGTAGLEDSTEVHFFFTPNNNVRNVSIDPVLNHLTNITPALNIPADQTKTFTEHFSVPGFLNITLLGVAPHMHLIGRNISCFSVSPQSDTMKLIRINDWDFHWQGFYAFKQLKKIAGGSQLYAKAFYDNTVNNPENPNSPPQPVSAGESTTDEMMLVYFVYTLYQPGDENIVVDSTDPLGLAPLSYYHGQQLLEVYPNPAIRDLVLKCYMEERTSGSIDIVDVNGKLVKTLRANASFEKGYSALSLQVGDLPAGLYQVRLRTNERMLSQKLLIQH